MCNYKCIFKKLTVSLIIKFDHIFKNILYLVIQFKQDNIISGIFLITQKKDIEIDLEQDKYRKLNDNDINEIYLLTKINFKNDYKIQTFEYLGKNLSNKKNYENVLICFPKLIS